MRPHPPRRHRAGLVGLVVATCLVGSAAAQGAGDLTTRRLLELERQLLAEDLSTFESARAAALEATTLLDGLSADLAARAAGAGSPGLADLEASLAAAAEARSAADRRLDLALVGLGERLRRIRLLAETVGAAGETVPDVLTGRWQITLSPGDVGGEIRLDQNGTLVTGSYRFDDGSRGSFEGTLVGDLLRLRRIDVTSGFDRVFEARVDPAAGVVEGRWQATVLGRGGAGAGEWVAVRIAAGAMSAAPVEPLAGAQAGPDEVPPAGTGDSPPAGPEEAPPGDQEDEER